MSGMKYRFESFGGVLALENPPMLVHVDQDFMRGLGHGTARCGINRKPPFSPPPWRFTFR
jgi:hypothetical protein